MVNVRRRTAKRPPVNRLRELYSALEEELAAQLAARRLAHRNAEAKGEASEDVWTQLLAQHLPHRYRVTKGIVIDADGVESQYIDIIIHDRQFTPLVFNKNDKVYIPAESVYAVIEAKQQLTRANIMYAGRKAATVRKLRRTSAPIVHAGGTIAKPKEPFEIISGIVAYESLWADPFGPHLSTALARLSEQQRLNFGIAANAGYFEAKYQTNGLQLKAFTKPRALAAFVIRLLAHLQSLGTVTAINYDEYSRTLAK
jgi:hypothetical protein